MKNLLRPGLGIIFAFLFVCSLFAQTPTQDQNAKIQLKFGKGLQVLAADSSMSLKIGFRFQSLYQSERSLEDGADWTSNLLIRRARLKFDGFALTPNLVYKVEMALSNSDLNSSNDFTQTGKAPNIILDAVIKWKFHKHFSLWVGQTKLPGNRERVVSSQKLQFVDRSIVNGTFNIDREMGAQLRSKFSVGEQAIFRPMLSWSFGESRNTTISNIGGSHVVGRMEFLPLGEFSSGGDYVEADLKREKTPKLALGITYSFNKNTAKQRTTGKFLVDADGNYFEHNLETFFIDMMFKYRGFSAMAEYANKRVIADPFSNLEFNYRESLVDANGLSYYTGNGINAQVSYLFKNNYEVATRYSQIMPDTQISFKGIKEYTLGVSKYIVGHNLKVQADVSLVDKEGSSHNKLRYRLQTEFAF